MNRQDKRRLERLNAKKEKLLTYRVSDLQKIHDRIILDTMSACKAIMAMCLNSKYDFGTKRINILFENFDEQFNCLNSGYLSGEDVNKWCNERQINYKWEVMG